MASRPASEHAPAGADADPESGDPAWVRSYLRTWPGKTYRVDATDDAREGAARDDVALEALEATARTLIDRVLREAQDAAREDAPRSGPPS